MQKKVSVKARIKFAINYIKIKLGVEAIADYCYNCGCKNNDWHCTDYAWKNGVMDTLWEDGGVLCLNCFTNICIKKYEDGAFPFYPYAKVSIIPLGSSDSVKRKGSLS